MASRKILLPVGPEVTLKVISRSSIDIILKDQHFERRIERACPMTFKVTLKVTRGELWSTVLELWPT